MCHNTECKDMSILCVMAQMTCYGTYLSCYGTNDKNMCHNTLRVRNRAGRTRLPPVTDRSDWTVRAPPACDRTPIERPTTPTQVTGSRKMSVNTEIDSRHTTSYLTRPIHTMGLFRTVWPETNYFRFTLPVSGNPK